MKKFRDILLGVMLMATLAGCGENAVEKQPQEMTEQKKMGETSQEANSENDTVKDDTAADSSGELSVPQGEMIKEQTFEVELDDWGTVTFASFAPENTSFQAKGQNPDIRFYLMDGEAVLYEFPGWNEEHTNADLFLAVSAIAFEDYNEDGLLDVITLCEYETMSGKGFQTGRIYFQKENREGFEEDTLLTEYLSKNYCTDSIASMLEAKEDYWDYKASMDGHRSVYAQLQIIAKNKELWLDGLNDEDAVYQYAVTDLDGNGRKEIIVSQKEGTENYIYSRIFQVNDSYDGLEECGTDFAEGASQPDREENVLRLGWQNIKELPKDTADIVVLLQESYELYVGNFD